MRGRDYRDQLIERRSQIEAELLRVGALQDKHRTQQQEVEQQLQIAETDLVKALLPDMAPGTLQYCATWAGLPALATEPLAEMEQERQKVNSRLQEIGREPLYIDRNNLCDPELGTLPNDIKDLEIHCESLSSSTRPAEAHPRWGRLMEVNYGTPDYKVGWWRLSHYQDWRAGEEISTIFKGQSFPKIMENYRESKSSLEVLEKRLAEKRRDLKTCQRLTREHQELSERLPRLTEIQLEKTRARLGHHLRQIPAEMLIEQFRNWPAMGPMLARYSGLNAKVSYLQQMYDNQLSPLFEELKAEAFKIDRKLDQLRNPKNWDREYEVNPSLMERDAKIQRRLDRYDQTYVTVYTYDRYDSVDLALDILWWDIFTSGRRDGSYISEVQQYHDMHPDYTYVRGQEIRDDWDDNYSVASAVEAGDYTPDLLSDIS